MACGVYKITNNITNKCYIGVSIHIEQRWKEHKNNKGSKKLYEDFLKYGLDNFSFEIIEECTEEELYMKEVEWIDFYGSYENGYNQNPGGENNNLQAILATRKNIYCYDLNGNFIKAYNSLMDAERDTGIPNTNISKAARGIDRVVAGGFQWRYIYSDSIEPYKRTCRFKEKPIHNQKQVDQYDLENNYIQTFTSIKEAANTTGANYNSIGMVCNGKRKTAGGFLWKFHQEDI